jgi:hypothetical protein
MAKDVNTAQEATRDAEIERMIRAADESADRATNPHAGEDPGLLPMNEDPRERRLKRNTM